MTTVFLVDDHHVVLSGVRSELEGTFDIVGAASDVDDAIAGIRATKPDVVLLDVRLKGESGLDLCADLLRHNTNCKVVFLTVYDDEQYLFQALRLGASGFLLKRVDAGELVAHLQQVREGVVVIDPTLAGRVAQSAARLHSGEYWPGAHLGLTQRESEVLALMVSGLSNRAIASRLVVGDETVKSHIRAIYRKLDVRDRAQAVATALREGVCQ
jgi:DNA-binding NarL/FixJ family response regulator